MASSVESSTVGPSLVEGFAASNSSSNEDNPASTSEDVGDDHNGRKHKSKRGILGVPRGPRMLFSFTKTELWSSEDEDDDSEYETPVKKAKIESVYNGKDKKRYEKDDDYEEEDEPPSSPETKKIPPKPAKLPPKKPLPKKSVPKVPRKPAAKPAKKAPTKAPATKPANGSANGSSNQSSAIINYNDFSLLFKTNKIDFKQNLPDDVLIYIFDILADIETNRTQTLMRLSLVCESWRKVITTTPVLWKKLNLTGFDEKKFALNQFLGSELANRFFTCVRELNLTGWSSQYAERIIDLVSERSNFDLEALNVKYCRNISSSFLQSTIEKCKNLSSLDLSAITSASYHHCQNPFSTSIFRPILESQGAKLHSLFLSENLIPSFSAFFSIIMDKCSQLEVIDISNITSPGKSACISIEQFQQSCPKLRILRAARIDFQCSTKMTSSFANLEELSIPYNDVSLGGFNEFASVYSGHSDNVIEQITRGAEKLKLLDIRGAGGITPRGLLKIPTWSLKHLWVSNCSRIADESLGLAFAKWNNSLEDVDLSWNKSEKCIEACIRTICENDRDNCCLKSIQLRGSAVSYEMLKQLIVFCPKLKSIDLQSCRSLPRGIKRSFFDDDFLRLKQDILDGKFD